MDPQHPSRDLEDQIFGGGDSDLSDVDADDLQHAPQPSARHREEDGDGEYEDSDGEEAHSQHAHDEDYNETNETRPTSASFPKFRKSSKVADSSERRPPKENKQRRPAEPDQHVDAAEEAIPMDPEELRRQELYERIDQAAGKNKKNKKRRRKGGDEDLEMMADEEVSKLRARMLGAVNMDLEANEERRPATAKMMLLPLVTATMQKSHLETAILDNGVLEAVKKWLEPLPDRSLPALNIQRSLLQLLTKMTIDTQSLKSSELGKVIVFYTKCKRVDPSIKRLADNLFTSWLRPIIRRPASYRSRAPLPVSSQLNTDSNIINRPTPSSQAPNRSQRARIPETIHQAFQFAPTSTLDTNQGDEGGSQNPAFKKGSQKATAKKTREWARKMVDAKKGQRMG
ncbi:hypothetical protein DFH28DRAFT_968039 [Melampsora americana]|nr:hypothetical protein DFH28DRAFT_968039 [Melampsora americana]